MVFDVAWQISTKLLKLYGPEVYSCLPWKYSTISVKTELTAWETVGISESSGEHKQWESK